MRIGIHAKETQLEKNYLNQLSLRFDIPKGIPYPGIERDDGVNHGFVALKGKMEDINSIPECQEDSALRDTLCKINHSDTAFFSVGCVSGNVDEEDGHRVTGYVEFSFNCRELVQDASNYFIVFFQFAKKLKESGFKENVMFHWEIESGHFSDGNCDGWTCRVFVNTAYHPTSEAARQCWSESLNILGNHFRELPPDSRATPIYT
jgi:hypothetical protein